MGNSSSKKPKEASNNSSKSSQSPMQNLEIDENLFRPVSLNKQTDKFPYNCIGMLSWKHKIPSDEYISQIGTAFLISENLAITAAHNVVDQSGEPHLELRFYPGLSGHLDSFEVQETGIASTRMPTIKDRKSNPVGADYCLLLLLQAIERSHYLQIGEILPNQTKKEVTVYGYPGQMNKSNMIFKQYGAAASIGRADSGKISHYVRTSQGHSGSPILMKVSESSWKVIGLHCKYDKIDKIGCGCQFTRDTILQINSWTNEQIRKLS